LFIETLVSLSMKINPQQMKNLVLICSSILILASCDTTPDIDNSSFGSTEIQEKVSGKYIVETTGSEVLWIGRKKLGKSHDGFIKLKSGYFEVENGELIAGDFLLDMESITCTDIEDRSEAEQLESHLKDEDFFETANHPEAKLLVKNASLDNGKYKITADLTIKDTTNEVSFYADLTISNDSLTASSDFSFDRTKWGIRYSSKELISNAKDNFILNDVDMKVKLVATKKKF